MSHCDQILSDYTLGLDIGIASVGAALLGKDRIIALHVRTFNKAEDAENGESLNKIRREARLLRRRLHRRACRMKDLSSLMKTVGLIDKPFVNLQAEGALANIQAWQMRSEGLDRLLSPLEWAVVLYHIVKHRGFQSNRKSELKADAKVGKMLEGINKNYDLMKEKNYRTVGELAFKDDRFSKRKRNKHGDYSHTFKRKELLDELILLFERQRYFHNFHAHAVFEQEVINLLMKRKAALSGNALLSMVGNCTLEPNEKRCPKTSIYAERFVWLSKLNNLSINHDGLQRKLTSIEHGLLRELPFSTTSKITYKTLRKKLDLLPNEHFNGIRSIDDETKVFFEAKGFHALRKCYEQSNLTDIWLNDVNNTERLHHLAYAITCYKEDTEIKEWLLKQGIEESVAEAVLDVSFEQFIRLSAVAIKNLLPHMEKGLRYDEAVAATPQYGHHSQLLKNVKQKYLPLFDPEEIRNPVVYRALNQARKLVNAIIKKYGSPASVHIELARDLSKSFKERKRIEGEQKEFQAKKKKLEEDFVEFFGKDQLRGENLLRFRFYKEQGSKCAYSLNEIDLNRLCEDGYVEIDHIIPYSRSFDNSTNNKVLVLTRENRNKANRTPYEYLDGVDHERWQKFYDWVKASRFTLAKQKRLLMRDLDEKTSDEFRARNLSDTRYICRIFKNHIESFLQLSSNAQGSRCVVLSGQLTAYLRARWGLSKQRENGDLHHALDAAVVAAASHGMVKRLSDYSRRGQLSKLSPSSLGQYIDPETGEILDEKLFKELQIKQEFPQPWIGFRDELLARLSTNPQEKLKEHPAYSSEILTTLQPIRVSRMPTRRKLGSAHKETVRSIGKQSTLLKQELSAVKVPLINLKLKDLENIVGYKDPRNQSLILALKERLEQYGGDGKKAFSDKPFYKPGSDPSIAPCVRAIKLLSKQKNGLLVRGGIADNSDMMRVDIFKKNGKFYAVPLYVSDSSSIALPNRAATNKKLKEQWEIMDDSYQFLFSLYKNDWVKVNDKKSIREGYFVSLDIATAAITLRVHDRDIRIGKNGEIRSIGIKTAKAVEKYHVDLLGNLYQVKNEQRKPLISKKLTPLVKR